MTWQVVITPKAREMLLAIEDRRIRSKIVERIDSLSDEPEKMGYPLEDELSGYRSIRTAGQRYRIIYTTDRDRQIISIIAVGIRKHGDRKDIYSLAEKIVKAKIVERSSKKKAKHPRRTGGGR